MFSLSQQPLEQSNLRDGLFAQNAGGFCAFEGWVRNHNEGKTVVALEYEAFLPLCQSEADQIIQEAKTKFEIISVKCVHRVGRLNVGDMAVWVGVCAAHRDASFKACRYVIDELKKRLPIWKKEFYIDGESQWIGLKGEYHEQSS